MEQAGETSNIQDGAKPTVLVIHQDSAVVDSCRDALAKHGFLIDSAVDGNEGIHKIYQQIPDVILAGSTVPELNGYQICRLIKNDSVMRKIPILLIADVAEKMDCFWGVKAGADDFLQKDEIPPKLLRKINMVLGIYDRIDIEEKRLLKASNEKNPFNIRTRLNQILDTSLVESTLMVEFRSLSDLIHDVGLLNYMLFSLMESILEYDAAAIFYNDSGKAPRAMTLHLPEGQHLPTSQVEGMMDEFFGQLKARASQPSAFEMLESEVIGVLDDEAAPVEYATRYLKEVHLDGRSIGAFCLYSKQKVDYSRIFPVQLVEDEIRLLMKLRHLYSQAETLAVTDSLTALFNHRHFMTVLQREFKTSKRYEMDLSLAIIGVDNFRQFNDEWGHSCGDEILRHVARIAENCFRTVDIPARFGGKQLAVVFPKTPGDQVLNALERFQAQVAATPLMWQDAQLNLTVSCGLVALSPEIENTSALIKLAEAALHQARLQGSNRIEISRV
ncbi:MAG TPA: diguanylate cyclase [Coleofasciculaceae cyanobacterium]